MLGKEDLEQGFRADPTTDLQGLNVESTGTQTPKRM